MAERKFLEIKEELPSRDIDKRMPCIIKILVTDQEDAQQKAEQYKNYFTGRKYKEKYREGKRVGRIDKPLSGKPDKPKGPKPKGVFAGLKSLLRGSK